MKDFPQARTQCIHSQGDVPQKGSHQKGLTLIELMIAMTLGLLLSAAATRLFVSGINMYRTQSSVANIQDTVIFGLDYMEGQAAMANLSATVGMNENSAWTGVVLSSSKKDPNNADNQIGNLRGIKGVDANLLSIDGEDSVTTGGSGWTGLSNVKNTKSDQLVIQYKAPYDMKDCEGNVVTGPHYDATTKKMVSGEMVIQRFYLRRDPRAKSDVPDELAIELACDAGRYTPTDASANVADDSITLANFGDAGVSLMKPVDHLRIRVGVEMPSGMRYLSLKEYKALVSKPDIVALQMGILARAKDSISKANLPDDEKFTLFDQEELEIKDNTSGYIRRAYTATVKLRNGGVS